MSTEFQRKHTFEQRRSEAARIHQLYPGRIPVIIERKGNDIPPPAKKKFLTPNTLTLGQFVYIIRRNIQLPPEKALFLFVKGTLPATSTLMRELYDLYKDDDGFLYMTYSGESTFGMGTFCPKNNT